MRDSTKELISEYEEIIALMKREDGVTQFEYKRLSDPSCAPWGETVAPQWNFEKFEYRVKPKPLETWVWKYPEGAENRIGSLTYEKKLPDEIISATGRVMVLMREVTK